MSTWWGSSSETRRLMQVLLASMAEACWRQRWLRSVWFDNWAYPLWRHGAEAPALLNEAAWEQLQEERRRRQACRQEIERAIEEAVYRGRSRIRVLESRIRVLGPTFRCRHCGSEVSTADADGM